MSNIELRDYFAAAALTGILSASTTLTEEETGDDETMSNTPAIAYSVAALEAYLYASAMLAEKAKHDGRLVALDIPNTEAVVMP